MNATITGIHEWTIKDYGEYVGHIGEDEHGFLVHTGKWADQDRFPTYESAYSWLEQKHNR
jgi:hypothetical protein